MSAQNATSLDLFFEFEGAVGERLAGAERLLRWLVQLHSTALIDLDAAYDGPRRTLLARARFDESRFGPRDEQRARFWGSRCSGRVRRGSKMSIAAREAFQRTVDHCDVRALKVGPSGAAKAVTTIATAAGLDAGERCYAEDRPTLLIDIGGPGWDALRWNEKRKRLVISGPIAPPLGDPVPVVFRVRELTRVAIEWARVVEILGEDGASGSRPPGFVLVLGANTSLRGLLRWLARGGPAASPRAAAQPPIASAGPLGA